MTTQTATPRIDRRPRKTSRRAGLPAQERICRSSTPNEGGCWVWNLCKCRAGYGKIGHGKSISKKAHRVSYEAFVGQIPDGHDIDHLCFRRDCVNPAHLRPLPKSENSAHRQHPPVNPRLAATRRAYYQRNKEKWRTTYDPKRRQTLARMQP